MNNLQSIIILGRQPALGMAELESLYGSDVLQPLASGIVGLTLPAADIDFSRLGGSIKLCKHLTTLDTTDWQKIERHLVKQAPSLATTLPDGKLTIGLSAHGCDVSPERLNATALSIKKAVRKTERSVRIVPNKAATLSSAQILHNKLTSELGWELVLIRHGNSTLLCQTVAEQDIEAYAARDQERPKRDARVGMLPPKLAQIIVNLATADTNPKYGAVVLDPFCGTGVVLQEASLMGFDIAGSDIDARMVEYTNKNLRWLATINKNLIVHDDSGSYFNLEQADATRDTLYRAQIIACEGYLGQPFSGFPSPEKLREVTHTCNQIMKGFLKNVAPQIASGTRLCIALPAWQHQNGRFSHLKLLDDLEKLGYNRVDLKHVRAEELLYYRPDQVVARELLVITRK